MGAARVLTPHIREILLRLVEAKGPEKDYPIPPLAHGKGGPDQMFIWNRMIDRHSPSGWGMATNIYKKSAKKHGIDPFGHTATLPQVKDKSKPLPKKKSVPARPPMHAPAQAAGAPRDIAYDWLQSDSGQKAMKTLMAGMIKAIHKRDPKAKFGFKDVSSALVKYVGKTSRAGATV